MIYPIRNIVAGIADLTGTDPVLPVALDLAARTGATVHLVYTYEFPDLVVNAHEGMGYTDAVILQEFTEHVQSSMEARVRSLTDDPAVRAHALTGPAAATIQEFARNEDADLIVVGATRRGGLARSILGTTAQRVLRGAPAPVLVVKGPLPERLQRVLLTTDLSPFSAGIHEAALDVLETLYDGALPQRRSVYVLDYAAELPYPLKQDLLERTANAEIEEFLAERRKRAGGITGVVRVGEPAHEILMEAEQWNADLMVLGTHGRSGPKRWLLGSVAESAVRGAGTHVLVVPASVEEMRILPVVRTGSTEVIARAAGSDAEIAGG